MAHLPCVLADAYIHELGEIESAGRDRTFSIPLGTGASIAQDKMRRMRILTTLLLTLAAAAAFAQPPAAIPAPPDVAAAPADAVKTPSGLATKVLKPGTG